MGSLLPHIAGQYQCHGHLGPRPASDLTQVDANKRDLGEMRNGHLFHH
jgi:hypothetical protein